MLVAVQDAVAAAGALLRARLVALPRVEGDREALAREKAPGVAAGDDRLAARRAADDAGVDEAARLRVADACMVVEEGLEGAPRGLRTGLEVERPARGRAVQNDPMAFASESKISKTRWSETIDRTL